VAVVAAGADVGAEATGDATGACSAFPPHAMNTVTATTKNEKRRMTKRRKL